MAEKIYWLSRRLKPAQIAALRSLHGNDVYIEEVVNLRPKNPDELAKFIPLRPDGLVYWDTESVQHLIAMSRGLKFGFTQPHKFPGPDGEFGVSAIYHVKDGKIFRVWENPNLFNDRKSRVLNPAIEY